MKIEINFKKVKDMKLKKISIVLALVAISLGASAQTVNVQSAIQDVLIEQEVKSVL